MNVRVERVRHQLFFVWCGLFLLYVCIFLFSSVKQGVTFPLAIDATWKVAYLIVPVLGAFAGFWFGSEREQKSENQMIERARQTVIFTLTGVLHGVVFLIIFIGIILEDFQDQEQFVSYPARVDLVLKFMLLIWSVSLLPVGWLLRGVKIQPPEIPQGPSN